VDPADFAYDEDSAAWVVEKYGSTKLDPEVLRSRAHDPYSFMLQPGS
jgi:hypothetical protein